jgi:glucose-6-phosphate-specific signal transduction histidine kinase
METAILLNADRIKEVSLFHMVDNSVKRYTITAQQYHNSLINNVNDKLKVITDETVVGHVISGLINAVITHTRQSLVHISAKELYGKMIEISIKDDNCFNTYAMALSLQDIVPLAEKIGGQLNITNRKQRMTTISFTFPVIGEGDISQTSRS